ncbi:histidine kinase [Radiobacillus sp. PE A8.2]|uniref:histidine kinase n=1 Tax=Radiobacillus sp. PE A8.2 TaxID=3380349 RepID=UPI00389097A0
MMEKWRFALYLSALFLVVVPISIVLITDVPFDSFFSHVVLSIAIILVMLCKTITLFEKRRAKKRFSSDIGALIGLSIVLVLGFFQ